MEQTIGITTGTGHLMKAIRHLKHQATASKMTPYQVDYINTSLNSLEALVNSIELQYSEIGSVVPQPVYAHLETLIAKFEDLIIRNKSGPEPEAYKAVSSSSSLNSQSSHPRTFVDDTTFEEEDTLDLSRKMQKRGSQSSSKFDSPVKNSFSRSSSVSKATITKENVLREPVSSNEAFNFLNFATPGLNQQLQGIFKAAEIKQFRDVKDLKEYSKSSNVFLD